MNLLIGEGGKPIKLGTCKECLFALTGLTDHDINMIRTGYIPGKWTLKTCNASGVFPSGEVDDKTCVTGQFVNK